MVYILQANTPYSPVCQLVFLICVKIDKAFEQIGQTSARIFQCGGGLKGIEQTDYIQTAIPLKPNNVHVCAVEYL